MGDLRPITLRAARAWVGQHHRHALPPRGHLFSVALWDGLELVGVGIAGRPVSHNLDDGLTLEVTRVCTLGYPNANSAIYGALCRAGKALGYRRAVTYTLATEPGTSLRAAGWTLDAQLPGRPTWDSGDRQRHQVDLFGHDRRPPDPKLRWVKVLGPLPGLSCSSSSGPVEGNGRPPGSVTLGASTTTETD
jgi:hypothetical protein